MALMPAKHKIETKSEVQNRLYRGEIPHKGNSYPGEQPAIVGKPLWDDVQAVLAANRVERATGARHPSLLTGMVTTALRAAYFGFGIRLRLIALQAQCRDSGFPRGVTCNQDSQVSQRKHPRSSLNAVTTGSKSLFPKLAHSL